MQNAVHLHCNISSHDESSDPSGRVENKFDFSSVNSHLSDYGSILLHSRIYVMYKLDFVQVVTCTI